MYTHHKGECCHVEAAAKLRLCNKIQRPDQEDLTECEDVRRDGGRSTASSEVVERGNKKCHHCTVADLEVKIRAFKEKSEDESRHPEYRENDRNNLRSAEKELGSLVRGRQLHREKEAEKRLTLDRAIERWRKGRASPSPVDGDAASADPVGDVSPVSEFGDASIDDQAFHSRPGGSRRRIKRV